MPEPKERQSIKVQAERTVLAALRWPGAKLRWPPVFSEGSLRTWNGSAQPLNPLIGPISKVISPRRVMHLAAVIPLLRRKAHQRLGTTFGPKRALTAGPDSFLSSLRFQEIWQALNN